MKAQRFHHGGEATTAPPAATAAFQDGVADALQPPAAPTPVPEQAAAHNQCVRYILRFQRDIFLLKMQIKSANGSAAATNLPPAGLLNVYLDAQVCT